MLSVIPSISFAAIFILLRAFANGGSSLTGLEAISDGVALFQQPEHVNARRTLFIMSGLLGSLVLGVSWFAHRIYAMPYESGTPTVISQIAKTIVGDGVFGQIMFVMVQAATMDFGGGDGGVIERVTSTASTCAV